MPGSTPRRPTDRSSNLFPHSPIIQKKNAPLPRHRHHYPQPKLCRQIQKPLPRRMINTKGVKARRPDQKKISFGFFGMAEMLLPFAKRTVRDALNKILLLPRIKKLSSHLNPSPPQGTGSMPNTRIRRRRPIGKQRNGRRAHSRICPCPATKY